MTELALLQLVERNINLVARVDARLEYLRIQLRACDELRHEILLASKRAGRNDWTAVEQRHAGMPGLGRDPFSPAGPYPSTPDEERRLEVDAVLPSPQQGLLRWTPQCRTQLLAHVDAAFRNSGASHLFSKKWQVIASALNASPSLPPYQKLRSAMGCVLYYINGLPAEHGTQSEEHDALLLSFLASTQQQLSLRSWWESDYCRLSAEPQTLFACAIRLRYLQRRRASRHVFQETLQALHTQQQRQGGSMLDAAETLMCKLGHCLRWSQLVLRLSELDDEARMATRPSVALLSANEHMRLMCMLVLLRKFLPPSERVGASVRNVVESLVDEVVHHQRERRDELLNSFLVERYIRVANILFALCCVPRTLGVSVKDFVDAVSADRHKFPQAASSWEAVACRVFGLPVLKEACEAAHSLSTGRLSLPVLQGGRSVEDYARQCYPLQGQCLGVLF